MSFSPADPNYERRTRDSFSRQGAMSHIGAILDAVCRHDAYVDKAGKRIHCATGLSTIMTVTGRAAVKD